MAGVAFWATKKGWANSSAAAINTSALSTDSSTPFSAERLAVCWSLAPRLRESRALTPTPVPTATEIIRFWKGKAMPTAVRASSLTLATK